MTPRFDRACTSPKRHHCRPGRWRDDDQPACDRALYWHYWCGSYGREADERIWCFEPIVRCLTGLSWRQSSHLCENFPDETPETLYWLGESCWVGPSLSEPRAASREPQASP